MALITIKHLLLLINLSQVTLALKVLIGYRRVSRLEAFEINQRKNIFRDHAYDYKANRDRAAQLGNGVYLSMKVDGYDGRPNDWWCYVFAEAGPLRQAPKVWIPDHLWDQPEEDIADYVEGRLKGGESPEYALRMSQVKGYPDGFIQMLIPTDMVNYNMLRTSARCHRNRHELPIEDPVDYDWHGFRNEKQTS
ncbi:hypothetical protein LX36DRAFT_389493 [Colletotrichum falcatum]|nr:hypothetical protein LX36DRAFT_389493 [Colletotrichum falcatum]